MEIMNNNIFEGILLEDPVVQDTFPAEPVSEFNPVAPFLGVTVTPLLVALSAHMVKESAPFVWLVCTLVSACYMVRRMRPSRAIVIVTAYCVLMLIEFI